MECRAPRRLPQGAARRRHRRGPGRIDRRRARPRGARREGRRGGARPRRPLPDGAQVAIVTSRDPEALELIRHDTAHVLAAAILDLYPGHEDLDRPADRRRLLLRLRVPRGRHGLRGRLRAHRGEDARARQGRRAVRARGRHHRRRRSSASRGEGQDYKVELIEDLVREHRRRDRLALHQRPVHRPLPRPARAVDQADQGVQAAVRRGRLLARRLRPPDAHAHLRHRLPLQGGPRGAPAAGSRRPARATTASSARSWTCSCSPSSAPARRSGSPTGW